MIDFNLRVQDLSRQSQTWGTELPVVREDDLFVDTIRFVNVPVDNRFRHMLRIYAVEPTVNPSVRVVVRDAVLPTVLASGDVVLAPSPETSGLAYSQLADFIPHNVPNNGIVVDVAPLTAGIQFWAFFAITNNETQHVTTLTPQR